MKNLIAQNPQSFAVARILWKSRKALLVGRAVATAASSEIFECSSALQIVLDYSISDVMEVTP